MYSEVMLGQYLLSVANTDFVSIQGLELVLTLVYDTSYIPVLTLAELHVHGIKLELDLVLTEQALPPRLTSAQLSQAKSRI